VQAENSLTPTTNNITITGVTISNGIFEHMNLANIISLASNIFDVEIPTIWDESTLLNCNFNNNINGGTISQFIGFIDHLNVQRQEVGSDIWITLQSIYRNSQTQVLNASFTMFDSYAQNNKQYIYRIVPVDVNGNTGFAIQQEILSLFYDAYIADANNIYNITAEYTIGDSQQIQKNAVYEPYGSKYPIVSYNADINYRSGSTTAILIAPTSNSRVSSYIDRQAQVNLVKNFNAWLTNGRAKILKDFNGEITVVAIQNSVSNGYYKELGNGLASTSFDWVEVGEIDQDYLDKLGMTQKFNLNYNDTSE